VSASRWKTILILGQQKSEERMKWFWETIIRLAFVHMQRRKSLKLKLVGFELSSRGFTDAVSFEK
jgi:hypothetical protein